MFISRDPIGLMGGMNTFQYAPNPTGWIDPFGLSCVCFGKNWDEKRKKHFQQMRQEADRLGIEMPRKFKDAGTDQAQRQLVEKIMSEGETKVQKYMTIEGASWTKLGDSIVIRDSADNFVTYLRKSQGGAADFWNGGHL